MRNFLKACGLTICSLLLAVIFAACGSETTVPVQPTAPATTTAPTKEAPTNAPVKPTQPAVTVTPALANEVSVADLDLNLEQFAFEEVPAHPEIGLQLYSDLKAGESPNQMSDSYLGSFVFDNDQEHSAPGKTWWFQPPPAPRSKEYEGTLQSWQKKCTKPEVSLQSPMTPAGFAICLVWNTKVSLLTVEAQPLSRYGSQILGLDDASVKLKYWNSIRRNPVTSIQAVAKKFGVTVPSSQLVWVPNIGQQPSEPLPACETPKNFTVSGKISTTITLVSNLCANGFLAQKPFSGQNATIKFEKTIRLDITPENNKIWAISLYKVVSNNQTGYMPILVIWPGDQPNQYYRKFNYIPWDGKNFEFNKFKAYTSLGVEEISISNFGIKFEDLLVSK